MIKFNESTGEAMKVEFSHQLVPLVVISNKALSNMYLYTDECEDEIGWLGTATYDSKSNTYNILDTFLFTQQVHATTTEITPEGLSEFASEIVHKPNGVDTWNNIRMWGHSHVNMSTSPSGQDDKQMGEFSNIGQEWFIRLIANKKGAVRIDLFHFKLGITYLDIRWEKEKDEIEVEIENHIKSLLAQIEEAQEVVLKIHEKTIEDKRVAVKFEVGTKVSKKIHQGYVNTHNNKYKAGANQVNTQTIYQRQKQWDYEDSYWGDYGTDYKGNSVADLLDNLLEMPNDIFDYFDIEEIEELSTYTSVAELELAFQPLGYESYFNATDTKFILDNIPKLLAKYKGA